MRDTAGPRLDVSHINLSFFVQVMKLMDDTQGTANCYNYCTHTLDASLIPVSYPGAVNLVSPIRLIVMI